LKQSLLLALILFSLPTLSSGQEPDTAHSIWVEINPGSAETVRASVITHLVRQNMAIIGETENSLIVAPVEEPSINIRITLLQSSSQTTLVFSGVVPSGGGSLFQGTGSNSAQSFQPIDKGTYHGRAWKRMQALAVSLGAMP
jgi:hypothetical protein